MGKTMSLPQPLPKSKSTSKSEKPGEIDPEILSKTEEIIDSKPQKEVVRNAVVNDSKKPPCLSEPQKAGNEAVLNQVTEASASSNSLAVAKDQPKPPTSPKPKVRKEELKMKEELAKN